MGARMTMDVKDIPLSKIIISGLNVRKNLEAGLEDSNLEDLAKSIKENGLLNPITVVKTENLYELVVGQRRFLACKMIGLETIPAIVRDDISDIDGITLSLIENIHRANIHPIDKAKALQILYETHGTIEKVSKESGLSTSTIRRYLPLLLLAPSIQEKISTEDGPAGIGTLSILSQIFKSASEQEIALERISGFNQRVQIKILQHSEGDLNLLERNREKALGGAFDIRICRGLHICPFIPDELRDQINEILHGRA